MTRNRWIASLLGALVVAISAAPAAAKPNFTGNWKLVVEKSDFGTMPVPASMETRIQHSDPSVKVAVTQTANGSSATTQFTYDTNGKTTENKLRGNPAKCTGRWEGDTLVLDHKMEGDGVSLTITDRYTLGDDGNLTLARKLTTPQGEVQLKLVMAKQ